MSTAVQTQNHISRAWWQIGVITTVAAVVANVIVFFVVREIFGVDYVVPEMSDPDVLMALPVGNVIVMTLVPAVLATLIYAGMRRGISRARYYFRVVGAIILVLSFAPILTLPEAAESSSQIGLAALHVTAAIVIVGVLTVLKRD